MLSDLPSPIAVVCHDAGAANIIFAWVRATMDRELRVLVRGPAARAWVQKSGAALMCNSIDEALDGAATLLSGTGWASDLEHEARRQARVRGVRSIAVIDHWTNYRERFTRDSDAVWPNEFWVTDQEAFEEASRCFPGQIIRTRQNLYLQEQLSRIAAVQASGIPELLYVLEPARDSWGEGEAGEFQALDYFIRQMHILALPDDILIRLRPHPSDPPGKYDAWIARHAGLNAVLDTSPDIAAAMNGAAWVAGCESYALIIALHAGRRVVCTLPPRAPACRLPHRGLIHLKEFERMTP